MIDGIDFRPVKIVILLWFIVACLSMMGCAGELEMAKAYATPSPDYPPLIVKVSDADSACRLYGAKSQRNAKILACAEFTGKLSDGHCVIFVDANTPIGMIEHEKLHCRYGAYHP